MKVALYGNVCNNMYALAKSFRQYTDIDAHLYLPQDLNILIDPESENPEIENNYPEWIHRNHRWDASLFFKYLDRAFIKELNSYDVFIASDIGVALSPYIEPKTIFFTSGADLTRMPFPKKFCHLYPTLYTKMKAAYMGKIQKKGIRNSIAHWTQPFWPFTESLKELDIAEEKIEYLFRVVIDTDTVSYNKNAHTRINSEIQASLSKFRFVILHPSRLIIKRNEALISSGQWKQNDLLFKGFAAFLAKNTSVNDACLVMPDRIYSPDKQLAKQIIADLGMNDSVVWIRGRSDEGFTKTEMIDLYSISDLVVDEFGIGWFGSIVLEGLACEKPVICHVDEDSMRKMYPWHPIISVNTVEDIASEIEILYYSQERRDKLGKQGRAWVMENHSLEKIAILYQEHLDKLCSDK